MKDCYLYRYMKPFRSAEWWTYFPQWSKFHFPIFLLPNPNCQFVLFQYTNVYLGAKFGNLKPTIDEKRRPQIWTCFWARHRRNIAQGNCNFLSTKCFINVNRSPQSTDCAAKNSIHRVMLRDQRGYWPSKIWENLDFSSDLARFLAFSSERHTVWS